MSLVVIPVKVTARRADGVAVVGATVRAVLTVDEIDDGLVVPASVIGTTDANGEVVLNLWPNSRGVKGSQYIVRIESDQIYYSGVVTVPEAPSTAWPVLLETIVTQPPYPPISAAQQAVVQSQENMVAAQGAQLAAEAAEAAAAAAVASASFADYAALRTYVGSSKSAYVTGYLVTAAPTGIAGLFTRDDSDTTSADNGGTIIVAGNGKRWKRVYSGPVQIKWFNPKGDGVANDTAPVLAAIAAGKVIEGIGGKVYKVDQQVVITEKHVYFSGDTILYTGAKNAFAMVANNPTGVAGATYVGNFLLKSTDTDTVNRTHGLCVGGSVGTLGDFRVEGFTGISVAFGSGVESYTGVTLPATQQAYYWKVGNVSVAPTSGWPLVIPFANNTNLIESFSTFPWGTGATPRPANCIDELVIGGNCNCIDRLSLEASPSNTMVLLLGTAADNFVDGVAYLERNPSWVDPPYPRIVAQAGSTRNRLWARHSYNGVRPISDLGTGNDIRIVPGASVNGGQVNAPAGGVNMVKNGRFENLATGWSDFSTNGVMSFGTGFVSGKLMRIDVTAGRVNVGQDLVAVGGYQLAGLRDQNVTVAGWCRTNLPGLSIKCAALNQNQVPSDGQPFWFTSTIKVPTGASTVSVQLITETSGLTGYAEWSDVTAVFGSEPMASGPRDLLEGSLPYDPPSLAAGTTAASAAVVSVPGAALGDLVDSVSFSLDTAGYDFNNAWVSAADTVNVLPRNPTAGVLNPLPGTLRVRVRKAA